MLKTERHFLSNTLFYAEEPDFQRNLMDDIKIQYFTDERCREIARICCIGYEKKDVLTLEYIEQNGFKLENSDIDFPITLTHKIAMQTKEALINEYKERCKKNVCNDAINNKLGIDDLINKLRDIQDLSINTKAKSTDKLFVELKESFFTKNESNLRFGISALDSDIKIRAGDLIIIGARTGCGKSTLALQFARVIASQGSKVLYFNLEMSERQVLERIISADRQINLSRLSYAESFIGNDEREKFESFIQNTYLENLKFCSGSFDIPRIQLEARRNLPEVIFVDYLQLVKPGGNYKGNRVAEVSEISHKLKALAMDLQIPIIALSQLNRESERKSEPTSSDLRECGDLENDASIVLLLWNDEKDDKSKYIKISKNRQGKCGTYNLYFEGKYMTFSEWKTPTEEEQLNIPFKADGD